VPYLRKIHIPKTEPGIPTGAQITLKSIEVFVSQDLRNYIV
jgi:hypothetical protein